MRNLVGLRFMAWGFRVLGFRRGFRVSDLGISGFGFGALGLRVLGLGPWDFGFWVLAEARKSEED